MKILWITNIVFPEAMQLLTGEADLKGSGGWMLASADALVIHPDIRLYVASVSRDVHDVVCLEGEKITYYLLPYGNGNLRENHEYEPHWRKVNDEIQPDVVHIHGTEFSHGLAYIKACGNNHLIVSIQGLTSVISKYYDYGLTRKDVLKSITWRDIIKGSVYQEKRDFKCRGFYEIEILKNVKHIIGRTCWDKAHAWAINPDATYHLCNETLRDPFYFGHWSYDQCVKHSIFVSQANYPIKGFHQLLKALPFVIKKYPDLQVRVAGNKMCDFSFFQRMKLPGYINYLLKLIRDLGLNEHVQFLGALDQEEMKCEYLNSNLFICSSAIENSPNSLCEAQMLGVPSLASYVGGVPDIMHGYENNMYRFEEVEMLSRLICDAFDDFTMFVKDDSTNLAHTRHDRLLNTKKLISIYKAINNE